MDSSSDSEGCQLYTRTAENIRKKRKQFTLKFEDFNVENDTQELDCDPVEEIDNTILVNTLSNVKSNANLDTNEYDQDKIPLIESRRNLRSNSKPQPKGTPIKRAKKQHTRFPKKRRKRMGHTSGSEVRDLPNNTDGPPTVSEHSVIVLDDDFEFSQKSFPPIKFNTGSHMPNNLNAFEGKSQGSTSLPNVIIDDDDEPVMISIEWSNGKTFSCKQFKLHRYQKFAMVFEELAKIEGLPISRISIMRDSKIVTPADTPESLDLKYYAGLTGSVSATVIDYDKLAELSTDTTEKKQEGSLKVQLRLENQRSLKFTIMKHQKMGVLYKKCSEELKCDETLIKLMFDGDYVEPKDLVSSLDLEDDDIFNVYLMKA